MANAGDIAWPVKTREMLNHHMNSTVWNAWTRKSAGKFGAEDRVLRDPAGFTLRSI